MHSFTPTLGPFIRLFQKQTRARAQQLRVELRALALDNSSVQEYLLKIRKKNYSLASIGVMQFLLLIT